MLIEFSEFNIKLLILLIYPIFKRLDDIPRNSYLTDDNQQFKTFRYYLSYFLSFIPFIILLFRSRNINYRTKRKALESQENNNNKDIQIQKKNDINILFQKTFKGKIIKSMLFLIALCLLGMFCYYFSDFFNNKKKKFEYPKQSIGTFFTFLAFSFLSYFILKQKMYKHNYISLGIITLMLFILFFVTLSYMDSEYIFLSVIYHFFRSLCFGAYDVLGKKYMTSFFKTPYFLMFSIGLIDMIGLLIFDFFIYYLDTDIDGIIIGFQNNVSSLSKFFYFILDIILQWIWNCGIWLTIYYLSPCHYFISQYISEFSYYIINAKDNNEDFYSTSNIVIFSIAFVINFISSIIFNEVIILNFCNLDYNTRKRIEQRESNDIANMVNLNYLESDNEEENNSINN